ncbi:MAG: ISNCY family transposase, partial [Cyanobacteriota bacterium]
MGKIEGTALCFNALLLYLRETVGKMKDPRKTSNNLRYNLLSVVVGAFSAFFMQNESFLEF